MNYRDKATARRGAAANRPTNKFTQHKAASGQVPFYRKEQARARSASNCLDEYTTARNLLRFIQSKPDDYTKLVSNQGIFEMARQIARED